MGDIDTLIGKQLAGETTAEERLFLEKWRTASPENDRLFSESERLWRRIGPVQKPLPRPLDIEAALKKTKARAADEPLRPVAGQNRGGRVFFLKNGWLAAAAAVAVAVAAVLFFKKEPAAAPVELAAADAPFSGSLADGSRIALNRHSSVRAVFSKKERRVELSGEAFFEVAHDAGRPFSVVANGLEVTAVGTAFNVDESAGGRVSVRMSEGRVRLRKVVGGDANNGPGDSQPVFLTAGEEAVFDGATGQLSVKKMPTGLPADGWLTHRFSFDGEPLGEVLPELERAYGVRISLKNNELRGCPLRARFSGEPIERVVEVLAETFSLNVEKTGDGFLLDGAGCE